MTAPGRILVVEDDESLREALLEVLGDEGHDVRAAAHGAEALATLETTDAWKPELLVLDLMMPVMDGYGVLDALGRDERTRHVPGLGPLLGGQVLDRPAVPVDDVDRLEALVGPARGRRPAHLPGGDQPALCVEDERLLVAFVARAAPDLQAGALRVEIGHGRVLRLLAEVVRFPDEAGEAVEEDPLRSPFLESHDLETRPAGHDVPWSNHEPSGMKGD